jgi:hypothetical protein
MPDQNADESAFYNWMGPDKITVISLNLQIFLRHLRDHVFVYPESSRISNADDAAFYDWFMLDEIG